MWSRNELTERLNLEWPFLQAPMGDFTTPALASEVSNAGALGGLGMFSFSAEHAMRRVAGFRQMSSGSLNVNYLLFDGPEDLETTGQDMRRKLQPLYDEKNIGEVPAPIFRAGEISDGHLQMLQTGKPEVVSFHFGLPEREIVEAIKDIGCFVICTANTVLEARALEQAGASAIIAQGLEAGGHRGSFTGVDVAQQPGLLSLLPQVVDAVSVPVIAAGGIADGRGIAAAMMLGASAVQMGTAFLQCDEANSSDEYRAAMNEAGEADTVVTAMASGRNARVVRNRLIESVSGLDAEPAHFPSQMGLLAPLGQDGDPQMKTVYCGQSVGLARRMPAADLIRTLAEETTSCLGKFNS